MHRQNGFVLAMILVLAASAAVSNAHCGWYDKDGDIDQDDFLLVMNNYGGTDCEGDVNSDCIVNLYDLVALKLLFGAEGGSKCPSPPGPPPMGAMELFVDPTGKAFLSNPTALPITLDGYDLTTQDAPLRIDQWYGFNHRVDDGLHVELIQTFGAGALGFGAMSHGTDALCEFLIAGKIQLQPSQTFSIGRVAPGIDLTDLTFLYSHTGGAAPDGVFEGAVVPEPATLSLLAMGAIAMIRRKR